MYIAGMALESAGRRGSARRERGWSSLRDEANEEVIERPGGVRPAMSTFGLVSCQPPHLARQADVRREL